MRNFSLFLLISLILTSSNLAANAQNIIVVRGTVSAPDDAERNYSDTVSKRLVMWLSEAGVPCKVVDDENISSETLRNVSVALLGYNPKLPKKEITALKTFTDRGGKLIVFYSSDTDLAQLMNMKLGNYLSAESGNRWSMIRFTDSAPPHIPRAIAQESRNIRPAYPVQDLSKAIAFWDDASGKQTPEPAWVQSSTGFWMSHVLLDDGDSENKQQMLLALVAYCTPKTWIAAADHYILSSSTLPGYSDFSGTVKGITSRAVNTPMESRARAALDKACAIYIELKQMFDDKQYPGIVSKCRTLTALLTEAYACIQQPAPGSFRGVWDQTGIGLYPGDWNHTCRIMAENGMTDLMPNMLMGGIAHYNSKILPTSGSFKLYGDQLSQCVEAAHKNRIKVHVWKGCWRLDNAPEDFLRKMKKENRLMVSDNGKPVNWLCPSNLDNLRMEKDAVREILQNYQVDGIQLDFIRFKDSHTCFCAGCKTRFESDTGKKVPKWPIPVGPSEIRKEFNHWRCTQITRLVRDVKAMAHTLKPDVKISAAVYGNYPGVCDSIAQDWGLWLREGMVDFVCPMDYIQDNEQFRHTIKRQLALPMTTGKIFPGIGVTATESHLSSPQTMDQLAIVKKEGATGFALFDLDRFLEHEVLPLLHLSATAAQ